MKAVWKLYQKHNAIFHDQYGDKIYAGWRAWLDGYNAGKSASNQTGN